jgi:hypothetical protein
MEEVMFGITSNSGSTPYIGDTQSNASETLNSARDEVAQSVTKEVFESMREQSARLDALDAKFESLKTDK